jgi:hypothetical protein
MGLRAGSGSAARGSVTGRAPYEAVLNRDAAALCGDFIPTTSADLVAGAPQGSTCESAADELFASTINQHTRLAALLAKFRVNSIASHGDHATAVLEDTKVRHHGRNTVRVTLEVEPVALQKSEGRWLISSPATLRSTNSCGSPTPPSRCTSNARVLVFGIITTSTYRGPSLPPIPTAVKHAGGKEQYDFKAGRTIYAQTGCAVRWSSTLPSAAFSLQDALAYIKASQWQLKRRAMSIIKPETSRTRVYVLSQVSNRAAGGNNRV